MMALTGPFSIPIRCLFKTFANSMESAQVDFGKVYVWVKPSRDW